MLTNIKSTELHSSRATFRVSYPLPGVQDDLPRLLDGLAFPRKGLEQINGPAWRLHILVTAVKIFEVEESEQSVMGLSDLLAVIFPPGYC